MLLVLLFLGGVNLYVLYYRHGTSVPALLHAAEAGRQASLLPGLDGPPGTPPSIARRVKPELQQVTVRGTVRRDHELLQAVLEAGEAEALLPPLCEVFAYEIGLPAEARAGDRFTVVVEKVYAGKSFSRYGRILAAEYVGERTGPRRAFFHAAPGSPGGYYDEQGESLARTLLRSPLRTSRFPAPQGSPVLALGAGKVKAVSPRAVLVAHAGSESSYTQLLRPAAGLAAGQKVRERQVLGYLGPSGVHVGLKVGGKPVEMGAFHPPRRTGVPAAQRAAYRESIEPLLQQLDPHSEALASK